MTSNVVRTPDLAESKFEVRDGKIDIKKGTFVSNIELDNEYLLVDKNDGSTDEQQKLFLGNPLLTNRVIAMENLVYKPTDTSDKFGLVQHKFQFGTPNGDVWKAAVTPYPDVHPVSHTTNVKYTNKTKQYSYDIIATNASTTSYAMKLNEILTGEEGNFITNLAGNEFYGYTYFGRYQGEQKPIKFVRDADLATNHFKIVPNQSPALEIKLNPNGGIGADENGLKLTPAPIETYALTWTSDATGYQVVENRRSLYLRGGFGYTHLDFRVTKTGTITLANLPANSPTPDVLIEVEVVGNNGGVGTIWMDPNQRSVKANGLQPNKRYIVNLVGFYS